MSKKCPQCRSSNVHLAATVPHALCVCFDCRHQWKNKYKPRKKTVFQNITQSSGVLAEKLVYLIRDSYNGAANYYWCSTVADGVWKTRQEAFNATVEKLKEVADEQ